MGSIKGGRLTDKRTSARAITVPVRYLGKKLLRLENLSAHDCRHFWAIDAARNGTDAFRLQEAGGWSSLVMPRRYVEAAEIANEGVRLSMTLYRTIGNLLEAGLIEVSGEDEDSSRRFYQITGVGEQAVKDEAHRLWELAKAGGATEPIPGLAFAAPVGGS